MSYPAKSLFAIRFALWSLVGLFSLAAPLSGAEVFNKPDVKGAKYEGPDQVPVVLPYLYIEPIAGLTTVRHRAPDQTALPLGTELKLFVGAPERAQVSFTGATITSRNAQGVFATCSLSQVGRTTIDVMVRLPEGTSRAYSCLLDVVPITVEQIAVTAINVSVEPFDLDETATNNDTMIAYFGESIAMLQPTSTGYRTSTNREIRIVPELNHPEFLPLMEWRIDGAVRALGGDERKETITTVGTHTYSVGPPDRSAETVIETYSVSITSHESGVDIVGEGAAVMFAAVTDPPGHEDEITWLSSTLFGTATPVVGHGPTMTVDFNDTYGPHPEGAMWQWLGVRADNSVFNQDKKCPMLQTVFVCGGSREPICTWEEEDCLSTDESGRGPMTSALYGSFFAEVENASVTQLTAIWKSGRMFGTVPFVGNVVMRNQDAPASTVTIESLNANGDPFFPAIAVQELYYAIDVLDEQGQVIQTLENTFPMIMRAQVDEIPPIGTVFSVDSDVIVLDMSTEPPTCVVRLLSNGSGGQVTDRPGYTACILSWDVDFVEGSFSSSWGISNDTGVPLNTNWFASGINGAQIASQSEGFDVPITETLFLSLDGTFDIANMDAAIVLHAVSAPGEPVIAQGHQAFYMFLNP